MQRCGASTDDSRPRRDPYAQVPEEEERAIEANEALARAKELDDAGGQILGVEDPCQATCSESREWCEGVCGVFSLNETCPSACAAAEERCQVWRLPLLRRERLRRRQRLQLTHARNYECADWLTDSRTRGLPDSPVGAPTC